MAITVRPPKLKKSDSTPARQVTGTSYVAKGAPNIAAPNIGELGSSQIARIIDPVPDLVNRTVAARTYRKMSRSDASVRASLRAGKSPILGGNYYIDPYNSDELSLVIQEFVTHNIFEQPGAPFLSTLSEILHFFEDGFHVQEKVWGLREWAPRKLSAGANRRVYTMIEKLAPRPASTITKFNYDDNGGPVSVQHNQLKQDGTTNEVTIPIDKLLIFTFDKNGGNLEGESILRSAYKHWWYKEAFYNIDAIQKERHAVGVPDIELPPGYTPQDKTIAHELGKNLRTNEKSYIVRVPGMTVGFAELHSNLVNVLESANHHDNMIMKNLMVQFLNLGIEGTGGGRATGATAADMFLKSMRYIANYICDCFNLYLIPQLVAYNFQTDQFPVMKVRNIGETKDLQMWATAFANLVDKNIITMDLEDEQWARNVMDMPMKLKDRPLAATVSNVKEQYLLRDNPDTPVNEDLAGQAAVTKAGQTPATGGGGTGATSGNVGKSPTSGA